MTGTVLASVPVNSEAGSYLTFAFPIVLFCVIATFLYVRLFGRPHARVPARRVAAVAHTGPPSPEAARAAAVAGGLPLAEGGGSAESGAEAAGAVSAALSEDDPDSLPSALASDEAAGGGGAPEPPGRADAERESPPEGGASTEGTGAGE